MPPRVASNEHTRIDDLLPPDLGPLDTGDDAEPLDLAPPDVGGSADPVPRIPVQQSPTLDARHPLTQPAYPTGSIRMEETGVVELELRIGLDGRVRDARVLRSSGHARLDRAAIDEALRAWRFKPATLDGEPIEGVYRIKVTFRLDDR
jgi:protein TonB